MDALGKTVRGSLKAVNKNGEVSRDRADLWNEAFWKKVREEVNALKHFVAGADSSLRMNTERTLSALEHLLAFLAEPNPRERLVSLYSTGTVRVAKR